MADENTKYAILTGSIAMGFSIKEIIVGQEAAEDALVKSLADGITTDKLEVSAPSSMNPKSKDYDEGDSFVVFGNGLGSGFTMYGPFPDSELAESFGERYRREDEWEIFTFKADSPTEALRERN